MYQSIKNAYQILTYIFFWCSKIRNNHLLFWRYKGGQCIEPHLPSLTSCILFSPSLFRRKHSFICRKNGTGKILTPSWWKRCEHNWTVHFFRCGENSLQNMPGSLMVRLSADVGAICNSSISRKWIIALISFQISLTWKNWRIQVQVIAKSSLNLALTPISMIL